MVVGNAVGGTAALAGAWIGWAVLRSRHRAAAVLGGWLALWGAIAVAQAGLMVRSSRWRVPAAQAPREPHQPLPAGRC